MPERLRVDLMDEQLGEPYAGIGTSQMSRLALPFGSLTLPISPSTTQLVKALRFYRPPLESRSM